MIRPEPRPSTGLGNCRLVTFDLAVTSNCQVRLSRIEMFQSPFGIDSDTMPTSSMPDPVGGRALSDKLGHNV